MFIYIYLLDMDKHPFTSSSYYYPYYPKQDYPISSLHSDNNTLVYNYYFGGNASSNKQSLPKQTAQAHHPLCRFFIIKSSNEDNIHKVYI